MNKATVNIEILRYLNMLERQSQSKVLTFIKTLFKQPVKKNKSKEILAFAGAFSSSDLEEINSAIAEGCETVDRNEW